jgi:MFS family permease
LGFIALGFIIDRLGRRPTFVLYIMIGAVALGVFIVTRNEQLLFLTTGLIGFGLGGAFGGLGPFLAELFSATKSRALGMAIAYNGGRAGALIAPVLIGAIGTTEGGFQAGMGLMGLALMGAAITILLAPETKGVQLQ